MNLAGCDSISGRAHNEEGKGTAGCLVFLLLLAVCCFVGIIVGPPYFANSGFETDVKAEVSRAGAHYFDDDTVIKDILDLAKRNEIRLKREDIKVERVAGQVYVTIRYSVPVDFMIHQRDLNFEIKASSFIGRL